MRSVVILFFIVTSSWAESVRRPPKNCPKEPCCGKNAHYEQDSHSCEKTCANRFMYDFMGACAPTSRCFCNGGYMRLNDDVSSPCVTEDQCPELPSCGQNEVAKLSRTICPPQTCQSQYIKYRCAQRDPEPGCDCIKNYLRDSNNNCIPKEQCPPLKVLPECGEYEVPTNDRIICPPQSCESIYTSYACTPHKKEPGCNCIDGYLRDARNVCIPSESCPAPVPLPECGENEVATNDRIICPPQSCESIYTTYLCASQDPEPGCNCIDGYLRDARNVCIPSESCPAPVPLPECGENEVPTNDRITCPPQTCEIPDEKSSSQSSSYSFSSTSRSASSSSSSLSSSSSASSYVSSISSGSEVQTGCNGDPNATYNECPSSCPATCENPNAPNGFCIQSCAENKCVCNAGYLLLNGTCVLPEQCPLQTGCNGDPNASYNECPTACPATCENPDAPNGFCTLQCASNKCVCNPGYLLLNGKCVLPEQCPAQTGCNGDPNASYNECPTACPATCENPNAPNGICTEQCAENKCVCNSGYLLLNGKCVLPQECPAQPGCGGDPNASYNDCPTSCPATCENPDAPNGICTRQCAENKCVCNSGYLLLNGKCVLAQECPAPPGCGGDPNASYKDCPTSCPATCENPNAPNGICTKQCAKNKCVCNSGYLLLNGKCVPAQECPATTGCNGDPNATYKECPSSCPATCEDPDAFYKPCIQECAKNQCVCNPGYLLLNGKCVKADACPGGDPCGPNGTFVECGFRCPNQYCPEDDSRVTYACKPGRPCAPGCACNLNYKRESYEDDRCILAPECPPRECTRPNEVWSPCPSECLAESCENVNDPEAVCNTLVLNCQPKCICEKGFFRDSNDICIPAKDCPQKGCNGDPNASYKECPTSCPATCENPNAPNGACIAACGKNQCVCNPGYLLLNGKCVLPEQCPVDIGCNGDPNAVYNECPTSCPATCENPDAPNGACILSCALNKCECKPGYLLLNGKCVLPGECPAKGCNGDPNASYNECPTSCPATCDNPNPNGICVDACAQNKCSCNPGYLLWNGKCVLPENCPTKKCPANEIFVNCAVRCPNTYCPKDDSRDIILCDPPYPCPSGCVCDKGYLRKSQKDDVCVKASKCPPVKCKRPNEEWNPSPPNCIAERCSDANKPTAPCDKPYRDYTPKCLCKKGFYRNDSDICVPAKECPNNNPGKPKCTPTCANPNPVNCTSVKDKNQCEAGQILSEKGGKCIKLEDCPRGCNGDPNAYAKECPAACPSTCSKPESQPCTKSCILRGCECAAGYILSKSNGQCIKVADCPGGNPCGVNGTFLQCKSGCPTDYCPVDDNRSVVICETYPFSPCFSGCACRVNHKRKSRDDKRCILSSECPPVNCTRQNEEWSPCPEACLAESCQDVGKPPAICYTLLLNCDPRCVCKKGYYRNSTNICVSPSECV